MGLWECVFAALKSLWGNKMRSALTLLGIFIGVASVIVMISMGQGAKMSVASEIGSLGAELLWVQPDWRNPEVRRGNYKDLTLEDADNIARYSPAIKAVAPEMFLNATVSYFARREDVTVAGTTESFIEMRSLNIAQGRFLSELDVEMGRRVVVLGPDLAEKLFGNAPAVGQRVKIREQSRRPDQVTSQVTAMVIGVMAKNKNKMAGTSDDSVGDLMAYSPVAMISRMTGRSGVPVIFAQAKDSRSVPKAQAQIETVIRRTYGASHKYQLQTQEGTLKMFGNIMGILTAVLGGIGSISLIVGGIGVMNIMLVTVTERTREIGIRKALGGKRADILKQFVIESVVLCLVGGVLGIVLGMGVSALIKATTFIKASVTPVTVFIAVASTTLVGVIFGVYPAYKAAKLDPIEALRYE